MTKIILFLLIISSFQNGCLFFDKAPIPDDATLETAFREKRKDFERIVEMFREDSKLLRVAYDFTEVVDTGLSNQSGNVGISDSRWNEYRQLFRSVDLKSGIARGADNNVEFLASSRGLSVGGLTKGYIYSENEHPRGRVECTAPSLDGPQPVRDKPFVCKKIDTNWFLFVSG